MKKINFKDLFKQIYKKVFDQPFWLFGFLFILGMVIVGILFWNSILFPKSQPGKATKPLLVLNKASLDKFIETWDSQEKNFQDTNSQQYPDIFKGFSNEKSSQIATSSSATSSQSH